MSANVLAEFKPEHDFFVGIDSDGCAFDTMEIKHKECFTPNIIKHWGLQAVSKYAREASEFVNLYSKWRGINRWPALVMVFDLLRERPEVKARGVVPPEAPRLREFMASGLPLSNDGLKQYMAEHPDPELDRALAWSLGVNATIADMVHGVPPFPYVRESLELPGRSRGRHDGRVGHADRGAGPRVAGARHRPVRASHRRAGAGHQGEHLALAARGKYRPDHILMIGDAPGDLKAARANDALFFPVNPGHEEASWERFYDEAMGKFLAGDYAGDYEARLIAEFDSLLPEVPPWKRGK